MTAPRRRRIGDPTEPRKRIVVFITAEMLGRLNDQATFMGLTRSAVAAQALEKGLPLLTDPHS
jgi:predicted nucleic acid-binding protein